MEDFTHINNQGHAKMVDVSQKDITKRVAFATGKIFVNEKTFDLIKTGGHKKGDVLGTAQIAGIMGAKKTFEIVPMCHILNLTGIDIDFELIEDELCVKATSKVSCKGVTGVEMEALTAVSVALLTVYDMCKAVQKDMRIEDIHLLSKSGGKSGDFVFGDDKNGI